jgi:Coenzyme PQQ synthesis protein D (PqqD)
VSLLQGRLSGKYASAKMTMPQARSEELVVEELEDEVLVYDSTNKRAHCLGATAARVWRACDGKSDVDALAETLGVDYEEVRQALKELEASQLLEDHGLKIVDGSSNAGSTNGSGLTRRQFTKIGAATAATPLIYSIAVNPAMAAATPTPFQCEIFTTQDCGASSGCGSISGCCCCCSGNGSCKTCGSAKFCALGTQPCAPIQGGGFGTKCSDAKGTFPATPQGCCGVTGATQCGCGFGPFAGCCHPSDGTTCTPSSTDSNCFPCCAGSQILSSAPLGCCKSSTVNCCGASPPACCAKSSQTVDCCTNPSTPCCLTAGGCP